jgi:hypothetical protein
MTSAIFARLRVVVLPLAVVVSLLLLASSLFDGAKAAVSSTTYVVFAISLVSVALQVALAMGLPKSTGLASFLVSQASGYVRQ